MKRDLNALAGGRFDLLVIGGGIFGAGIARDAAMRGLRVALVDKGDWAGGTSSRSSKLIHGGFRYLEQWAWRLVAEACRERRILQRIAPGRVKPIPFLLPVFDGDPRPLWKMRLGMTAYDVISRYDKTEKHQTFSAELTLREEPSLRAEGLRGAIRYFDCQEDDARFCLDNILHAASLGACCANYCEVNSFRLEGDRIAAAGLVDVLTGERFDVRADVFVNAGGPWVEKVAGLAGNVDNPVRLSPTKGVHLLLPKLTDRHAITFQSRRDGRILFLLPWHDGSLIGTTDTDFTGDPGQVHADEADVDYLLSEVNQLMPQRKVGRDDIIIRFAGVRPLLRSDDTAPSARGREHRIVRQRNNLLSVAGGKYTTYRAVAEAVVGDVYEVMGSKPAACTTASTPLPNPRPPVSGEKLCEFPEVFESDVRNACQAEMAMSVGDVMYRRTPLALSRSGGHNTATRIASIMSQVLGWTSTETEHSLRAYLEERAC